MEPAVSGRFLSFHFSLMTRLGNKAEKLWMSAPGKIYKQDCFHKDDHGNLSLKVINHHFAAVH